MNMNQLPYRDRRAAGRALAASLHHLLGRPGLIVLGLPRGGVPVAYEVALELDATLDVLIVRKLGHPHHSEYAIGAIASGGVRVMNPEAALGLRAADIERIVRDEQLELQRREHLYRGDLPGLVLHDRVAVIVDDGLATGSTMRAAVRAVREQQPAAICVAVPVGAREACAAIGDEADEVVCPARPSPFRAVGLWYHDFPPTQDEEVRSLLAASRQAHAQSQESLHETRIRS